ncbi:MAG: hypothetical protein HKL80_04450 [Acidimicrobiales bacterium]|nr:hypothetical protein [Acidimicrobiales bacterium]
MISIAGTIQDRRVLVVSGVDSIKYLHSQLSNDIENLEIGTPIWSLLLKPTGKLVTLMRVLKATEELIYLEMDKDATIETKEALERFKIRVKANIELSDFQVVRLPRDESLKQDLYEGINGCIRVEFSWNQIKRLDYIVNPDEVEVVSVPDGDAEVERIMGGFPKKGQEYGSDLIPAEIPSLVENAVSFTKGCYIGQELVARVDSRGSNTPKTLKAIHSPNNEIMPGDKLFLDSSECGVVTSSTFFSGHGYIGLGFVNRRGYEASSLEVKRGEISEYFQVNVGPIPLHFPNN